MSWYLIKLNAIWWGKYQGYHQMLEMSRSIHDIRYQGDICMLRIDTDIQPVGTDMQNHGEKGS